MTTALSILQEPIENYLKSPALSPHDLRRLRQSPAHYEYYKTHPNTEEKNQINLNSAIHCYLRNKDEFYEKYIGAKINPWAKKEEKAKLFSDHQEMFDTKIVIDKGQFSLIETACESLRNDKNIISLFASGQEGMSGYKHDDRAGINIKARLSWLSDTNPDYITDYSIYETPYRTFYNNIFISGYHNHAQFTMNCFDKKEFMMVAVDSIAPHPYRVQIMHESIIEKATLENRMILDVLSYCKKNKYYFNEMQFESVKNIYRFKELYHQEIKEVFTELDKFMNKEDGMNQGWEYLTLPKWV